MKIFQKFGFGLAFILAFAVLAIAQTENKQSATLDKIAAIDTKSFEDKEKGIKELVDAYAKLSDEFKPQNDEIITMFNKYKELSKKLEELNQEMNAGVGLCYSSVEGKIKELQDLENKIKDFSSSARNLYIKREIEVISPIKIKIGEALKRFAEEKGYLIIVDRAAFDEGIILGTHDDVTDEFIKYYNSLAAKQQ